MRVRFVLCVHRKGVHVGIGIVSWGGGGNVSVLFVGYLVTAVHGWLVVFYVCHVLLCLGRRQATITLSI